MQKNLIELVKDSRHYRKVFERARASRSRVTSVYDISTRCNLFCEGCLFFDRDGGFKGETSDAGLSPYERLFVSEKERGVNYPLLAGAEPSLEQQTLHLAAEQWDNGMVHTNGIKKIDQSLPFRLYVSVWGGRELTRKWRGADCYEKTLSNATDDRRVIMNYTINSQNIDDIIPVVRDCSERNLTITFQIYSPTSDYLDYLQTDARVDHTYIQSQTPEDNLLLSHEDFQLVENTLCKAIDEFPDTVVFTKALARWICSSPVTFPELSEDKTPQGCFAGNDPRHQHHLYGGHRETRKTCGHPSISCRTCKLYTTIYPAFFAEKLSSNMTREDAIDFLDAHNVFDIIYEGHRQDLPINALREHRENPRATCSV